MLANNDIFVAQQKTLEFVNKIELTNSSVFSVRLQSLNRRRSDSFDDSLFVIVNFAHHSADRNRQ